MRFVLFGAGILLAVGLFVLLQDASVGLELDFANAQYYADDDDDDDDDEETGQLIDGIFNDGRINGVDVDAPTVVFCENGTIALYSAIGRGNARVTIGELVAAAAQAIQTGQPVTVTDSSPGRLDALPNRTLRLLAARSNSGNIYQFTFSLDACGTLNLAAFSASPVTTTGSTGSGGTYTVLPGDTLTRIARINNTTVQALVSANNIPNPDRIFVGQSLVIP